MTLYRARNQFDISQMNMIVLMLPLPVVVLLPFSRQALATFVIGALVLAQGVPLAFLGIKRLHLPLPVEPWPYRDGFFNLFGWQLIYFSGFALMGGWLRRPPVTPMRVVVAAAFVMSMFAVWLRGCLRDVPGRDVSTVLDANIAGVPVANARTAGRFKFHPWRAAR